MCDKTRALGEDFDEALALTKAGDTQGARSTLGLDDKISDHELIEGLAGFSKGIECFTTQRPIDALEPLRKASIVADASRDDRTKLLIQTLTNFSEGIASLAAGDAHRAVRLLDIGADSAEQIALYIPNFEFLALSIKAASFIALGRSHMNASDIPSAEREFGRARQMHNVLLGKLDPNKDEDSPFYSEIYATRVELCLSSILNFDLPALDVSMMSTRLKNGRTDVGKLKEYIEKIGEGPSRNIMIISSIVFSALENLLESLRIVMLKQRPLSLKEVRSLVGVDEKLFLARQLVDVCGERGEAFKFHLGRLGKLQQNVLTMGKAATQDFGRFSGAVSLASFLVVIIVLHLTLKPTGIVGVAYAFGALIVSLITGFGFGALRFKPLLKLYSDAIRVKPGETK